MRRSPTTLLRFALAVVASALAASSTATATADAIRYTVTDLGTLPGGFGYEPHAINAAGQVVGTWSNGSFLYANGTMTDTSGSANGFGTNDAGRMTSFNQVAVNNLGEVAGVDYNQPGTFAGLVYVETSGGVRTSLGTNVDAVALNNEGQVVGRIYPGNNIPSEPMLFSNGKVINLGLPPGSTGASAYAINDKGDIVGGQFSGSGHAFLYSSGVFHDLGTLGGSYGEAHGINNIGQIVGYSALNDSTGGLHAFLYQDGTMLDLNNLVSPSAGWVLTAATAINDSGAIVGNGTLNGVERAFLLTPTAVPEPSALAILGSLFASSALARAARRFRRGN